MTTDQFAILKRIRAKTDRMLMELRADRRALNIHDFQEVILLLDLLERSVSDR